MPYNESEQSTPLEIQMKKLSIALVAALSLVSAAGCKKKSEPAPATMSGSSDKPAEPAAAPTTPPAAPATPPAAPADPAAGSGSAGSGSN